MKKDIHPKYNEKIKVICVCGRTFETGSILPEIKTELCSACHPFYTGKQKLVDTARRVEKFQAKIETGKKVSAVRKGKKIRRAKREEKKAKKEVTVKAEKNDLSAKPAGSKKSKK